MLGPSSNAARKRARASWRALASLPAFASRRPARGAAQRSGRNSLSRISTQRRPNSGRYAASRGANMRIVAVEPLRRRRESAGAAAPPSGRPGCSRMSAVSFTGSSQPKYSKSTNASEPSGRRSALWKPKSDGTRLRHSCGRSAAKSRLGAARACAWRRPAKAGVKSPAMKSIRAASPVCRSRARARLDLARDLGAAQAGLGRRAAAPPASACLAQRVHGGEERDARIDVGVARRRSTGTPSIHLEQQRSRARDRRHAGAARKRWPSHQAQRADLGAEPVARIVAVAG